MALLDGFNANEDEPTTEFTPVPAGKYVLPRCNGCQLVGADGSPASGLEPQQFGHPSVGRHKPSNESGTPEGTRVGLAPGVEAERRLEASASEHLVQEEVYATFYRVQCYPAASGWSFGRLIVITPGQQNYPPLAGRSARTGPGS